MVLHLPEFTEENPKKGEKLNYYCHLPQYLHEMSVEEIMEHINRNGVRALYHQQSAVLSYFLWLHKNYGIDLTEKNYKLRQLIDNNNKITIGFYNLNDLKQGIEKALQTIEVTSTSERDYDGLIAIFYLEWYGVLPKSAISIKLTDVSNDGTKIYIPVEDRTIEITDSGVAAYFADYKQKTGFKRYQNSDKEIPYQQNTFYRNTSFREEEINEKTIYNARLPFVKDCGDKRFAKKRVYYSGRYNEMLKNETYLNKEFTVSDLETREIISKIFNSDLSLSKIDRILREYVVFKREYLERI